MTESLVDGGRLPCNISLLLFSAERLNFQRPHFDILHKRSDMFLALPFHAFRMQKLSFRQISLDEGLSQHAGMTAFATNVLLSADAFREAAARKFVCSSCSGFSRPNFQGCATGQENQERRCIFGFASLCSRPLQNQGD